MGQLEVFATQTAQAAQGGGQVIPTEAAPTQATPAEAGAAPTEVVIQPTAEAPTAETQPQPEQPQPTATTAPPVEVPEFDVPNRYTLQRGEYPYCIARRFDVNPSDLLRINNLGTNQTVYAGTQLQIPQSGSFPGNRELRDHPTNYTVSAGDSIYSIACLFGDVDPRAIAAVNGLDEPYQINAGQRLQIP